MENTEIAMVEFNTMLFPGSTTAGLKDAKRTDLWKVQREKIKVLDGFNVRIKNDDYLAQVRLIADSMKANGFFPDKPIAGFVAEVEGENVVYVIDGHTRLDAYDLAVSEGTELQGIPMVIKPKGTSMEDLTVALVVSNNGRQLTPYETALVCKRLVHYGMDESEVARRIGMSKQHVANLLMLVAAPREIGNFVQEGKVSASLAVATLKTHGSKAVEVLKEGLANAESVGKAKVTEKHLKEKKEKKEKKIQGELPTQADDFERKNDLLLSRGIDWIKRSNPDGIGAEMLLAFLTGTDVEEIQFLLKQADLEDAAVAPESQ